MTPMTLSVAELLNFEWRQVVLAETKNFSCIEYCHFVFYVPGYASGYVKFCM